MAISLVGTPQVGTNNNGNDVTLTFDGTPAEDDVVVVFGGTGDESMASGLVGPSTAGYTELELHNFTSNEFRSGIWYKRLGASPDSEVVCQGSGHFRDGVGYGCYVLRGVDETTLLDAATVETGPATSANPDLDAITTVTDGAWVLAIAGKGNNDITGAPSGYSNLVADFGNDSNDAGAIGATKEVTSAGSEDPGAFTGASVSTIWVGWTVAIRPAGAGGGGVEVALDPASITVAAQALDLDLTGLEVSLTPATMQVAAQALDLDLTALSVALQPATMQAAAQALGVDRATLEVALATAVINLSAQSLDLDLTAKAVALDPATIELVAQAFSVDNGAVEDAVLLYHIGMMGHW